MNRIIIRDPSGRVIEDFYASDDIANTIVGSDTMKIEKIKVISSSESKDNN